MSNVVNISRQKRIPPRTVASGSCCNVLVPKKTAVVLVDLAPFHNCGCVLDCCHVFITIPNPTGRIFERFTSDRRRSTSLNQRVKLHLLGSLCPGLGRRLFTSDQPIVES